MDWNFGTGVDDLVVPKDEELSDRLPSPKSRARWDITAKEGHWSPNSCFITDGNLSTALKFRGLFDEFETEPSLYNKDECSGSSVSGGGLLEESLHHGLLLDDRPGYQLDEFTGIEQMDDIFLNSLLEDLPWNGELHKPVCFSSESQCGWENKKVSASLFIPCNSEQEDDPPVKTSLVKFVALPEENSSSVHLSEKQSLEESVLSDFEMVMAQLTETTRICFRDAFYRLAKNSEQQIASHGANRNLAVENPDSMWTSNDEKMRSGRKKAIESETNTVDRAIANLTFNKMDSNVRDFDVAASLKSNPWVTGTRAPGTCSSNQTVHRFSQAPILASDAEVAVLVQADPVTKITGHRDLLRSPAENKINVRSSST